MGDELARIAFFGDRALARRNACAIDEQPLHAMGGASARQRGVNGGFVGHIGGEEGPADLRREILGRSTYHLEVAGDLTAFPALLTSVEPTLTLTTQADPDATGFRAVTLTTDGDDELGEPLLRALLAQDLRVRSLSRVPPTLEDVFLAATRRSWDTVAAPKPAAK